MGANTEALWREFMSAFGREPAVIAEAPGRVNIIGEHTDYNGGYVLPVAIDRTVAVAATLAGGDATRVCALDFGECDEFAPDAPGRRPGGDWRNYARGVAWALQDAGHRVPGADLAITGDVPHGAGLSSSAAVEVAAAGALAAVSGLDIAPRSLALLAQRAENEFASVQCGIMDQFAAALSREGCALLLDCRSLETQAVPLPASEEVAIVVVDSKAPRRLGDTPYNRRREECSEAARLLGVESLRDASQEMLDAARESLPDHLYRRVRHVITENGRVLEAVETLRRSDLARLGRLMHDSHESLRNDYEVSCAELDLLVDLAQRVEGVLGARLTGGGFGGCTVNFVRREAIDSFRRQVVTEYAKQTGVAAEIHVCRAVEGLRVSHV